MQRLAQERCSCRSDRRAAAEGHWLRRRYSAGPGAAREQPCISSLSCLSATPRPRRAQIFAQQTVAIRCGTAMSRTCSEGRFRHCFALFFTSWLHSRTSQRADSRRERRLKHASEHSLAPPETAAPKLGPESKTRTLVSAMLRTTRVHAPSRTPTHPAAPRNANHPPLEPPKRHSRSRHVGDVSPPQGLDQGPRPLVLAP